MTSQIPTGSRAGLGKCGQTWGGANSRAKFLAASREWQFVIKCSAFSGPRPHSLQVGSPLDLPWVLYLKWLASCSKPSQPVRRRIRKLVRLVAFVSPLQQKVSKIESLPLLLWSTVYLPSFGEIMPGYLLHILQSDHRCNFWGNSR